MWPSWSECYPARWASRVSTCVQQTMAAHNVQNPGEHIKVRIGLHTGEAINEGEDLFQQELDPGSPHSLTG